MREPVGIGGVLAAFSVTSDLTRGHPPGEAMRACLLAGELARRAGVDDADRRDVHYATLLRFAGCPATSHELAAALGGDDVAVRARGDLIDPTRPAEAVRFLLGLGEGVDRLRRLGHIPVARAEGIVDFIAESGRLTAGTLRAVPEAMMADGEGRVAVLTRVSGTRPDGGRSTTRRSSCSRSRATACAASTSSSAIPRP